MTKIIHTKVTDEMYYNLATVKAKLRIDTWLQLFQYIINQTNVTIPEQTKQMVQTQPEQTKESKQSGQPKQPEQTEITTLCTCGHPENYHSEDGCMGDGGLCECKQFMTEEGAPA